MATPVYARPDPSVPEGQSPGPKALPSAFIVPKTLKQTRRPVYGLGLVALLSGQNSGLAGLPAKSTAGIVGFGPRLGSVVIFWGSALSPTQPSQKRKIPFLAESVRTRLFCTSRRFVICWSHNAKKKVLLRIIGPPKLRVYWCVFLQGG